MSIFVKATCEIVYEDNRKIVKDEFFVFDREKESEWMLDTNYLRKLIAEDLRRGEKFKKLKISSPSFCDNVFFKK